MIQQYTELSRPVCSCDQNASRSETYTREGCTDRRCHGTRYGAESTDSSTLTLSLGKTLTMLALVIATLKDVPREFSRATLIGVQLTLSTIPFQTCLSCSLICYVKLGESNYGTLLAWTSEGSYLLQFWSEHLSS